MNVLSYKYDFELSSKKKIFLWLYQVLPNIDVIKDIYELKEDLELEDVKAYHGLCPRNVKTIGSWIPTKINDNYKIMKLGEDMLLNALLMKLIMDKGFICSFNYYNDDYQQIELDEIENGNWFSVVPNINENPPLHRKIKLLNIMYDSVPVVIDELYKRIHKIYLDYKNNEYNGILRIAIDQNDVLYFPRLLV